MNVHAARLAITEVIRDVLLDLADAEGELSEDEYIEMEETLLDAADLILDSLGVQVLAVTDVHNRVMSATFSLGAAAAS
jgi:hypothetical protein